MDLYFILVKPAVPGNVGAAARAINTMGYTRLRLVAPCDYLDQEARMMAHGSEMILENAEVFTELNQAIADLDMTVATTASHRGARVEYLKASEIPAVIQKKGAAVKTAGLVFGREESGLTNDEIRMCDLVSSIPMHRPYPSLNLGQAVMVFAYIMGSSGPYVPEIDATKKDPKGFRVMMDKSKQALTKLKITGNPALYHRILERLATLGEDDVHLLHTILNRYLK
jgi:tRNA/rRNA methyltransferase